MCVTIFSTAWREIPPCFDFYIVTRSYSSCLFLCALGGDNSIFIRLTHANVWESMEKPCSYRRITSIKSCIFYYKSCENCIRYYKLCALCLNANHYHHSTKLYQKKYHSFVAIGLLLACVCTRNNTDGNKFMIFTCIALYYGDNQMKLGLLQCPV